MEFKSTSQSIRDMLSLKRKYIIPRFQREYSWTIDELTELWNDLLDSLIIKNEHIAPQEYFLGSIVLVGDEDGPEIVRQVVDGQQRLMTLTIIFSVLAQKFKSLNEDNLSKKIHEFIIGEDENGEAFTKLVSETPKPFFQFRIQQKEIDFEQEPGTEEEKAILNAYNYFDNVLSENRLLKEIKKENGFNDINEKYLDLLKVIRDQVLSCKVIYVTVKSIDDAYQIFEVLNAKGKDLEPTDIIKNSIFSILDTTEPADFAYETWKKIKNNIALINGENIKSFYRHFWLSQYGFVTANRLVTEFNKKVPKNQDAYTKFILELQDASHMYRKIANPNAEDWKGIEQQPIFEALVNINKFGIKQVRTILLAMISAKEKGNLSNKALVNTLEYLEYFHFVFNAICSNRASALERKNSTYARKLNDCTNKQDGNICVRDYIEELKKLLPSYEVFESAFIKLYYTQDNDKDKKIIQYILKKYDKYCEISNELSISQMTIEHILPESTKQHEVGFIGNLLPLGEKLNGRIGDEDISIKLKAYEGSSFASVKKFVKDYRFIGQWTEDEIIKRSKYMAKCMYDRKIHNFQAE